MQRMQELWQQEQNVAHQYRYPPQPPLPPHDFTQVSALTIDGARRAMAAAVAEADRHSWLVTIAVVDHSGSPLLLERRGAAPATVDLALGKARTAAMSGRDSAVFEHSVNGDPSGGQPSRRPRLALLSAPSLVLMEGALPILVGGVCVGAVGVSGVRSEQDAQVARVGVAALSGSATALSAASYTAASLATARQPSSVDVPGLPMLPFIASPGTL